MRCTIHKYWLRRCASAEARARRARLLEEQQEALKEAVQAQANQIRQAYIGTLKLKQEAATKAGNASGARAILNEINACGATGRAFLEHLGSGVLDTAEGR